MSSHREAVFDFFLQRHIVPKEDWLDGCLEYLDGRGLLVGKQSRQVFSVVFDQWVHSDLQESTYANIEQIGLNIKEKKISLTAPVVVQVLNILDVGTPLHTQFKKLTHEFVDNSGFEALPDQDEKNGWEQTPRRCILMEVSDGEQNLRLMEYHKIPFLSLLTPPGSKILLLPGLLCRRGIVLLTPALCQLIGGDCMKFKDGRPLEMMAKRLSVAVPKKEMLGSEAPTSPLSSNADEPKSSTSLIATSSTTTVSRIRNTNTVYMSRTHSSINRQQTTSSSPENRSLNLSLVRTNDTSILDDNDFDNESVPVRRNDYFEEEIDQMIEEDSTDHNDLPERFRQRYGDERPSTSTSKPVAQIAPTNVQYSRSGLSPSRVDCGTRNEVTRSLKNSQEYDPRRRESVSSHNGIRRFMRQQTDSPPSKRPRENSKLRNSIVKTEPLEIINLDDSYEQPPNITNLSEAMNAEDERLKNRELEMQRKEEELMKREENASKMEEHIKKELDESRSRMESPQSSRRSTDQSRNTKKENPILIAFKELKVVRIADVVSQMRFAVGSTRKYVQAIVVDIIEPFRVVDDLWTQKVAIMDDSLEESLACMIHNDILTELLGMTPTEAVAVAQSKDRDRQKEGKAKLEALQDSMSRLDLVFQVEFFSQNRVVPVIRGIKTLHQMLLPE